MRNTIRSTVDIKRKQKEVKAYDEYSAFSSWHLHWTRVRMWLVFGLRLILECNGLTQQSDLLLLLFDDDH